MKQFITAIFCWVFIIVAAFAIIGFIPMLVVSICYGCGVASYELWVGMFSSWAVAAIGVLLVVFRPRR